MFFCPKDGNCCLCFFAQKMEMYQILYSMDRDGQEQGEVNYSQFLAATMDRKHYIQVCTYTKNQNRHAGEQKYVLRENGKMFILIEKNKIIRRRRSILQ